MTIWYAFVKKIDGDKKITPQFEDLRELLGFLGTLNQKHIETISIYSGTRAA